MTDIIIIVLLAAVILIQMVLIFRKNPNADLTSRIKDMGEMIYSGQKNMNETMFRQVDVLSKNVIERQEDFRTRLESSESRQEERFKTFSMETEQKLDFIRHTLENRLRGIQEENSQKLDEMRGVVDEKLQDTLNKRMTESFKLVSDRLEQVYKGLGEMQNLATGVGELQKVLTNVKTRGILGEIQLGAILEDILSPEQYEKNCRVKKGSSNVVEFAVKIPVEQGETAYLPIDAKFPGDTYRKLVEAREAGDLSAMDVAAKELATRIKGEAKDISDKYIYPPETTEFAIMFLPFEGLYSEVVNMGLLEEVQHKYRVTIAGPSTMAAMLCSMRMCFRNVAVQRRSDEVWKVLGSVKKEFENFEQVLNKTQKKLIAASNELDNLVGVRTRAINRSLSNVTSLDDGEEDISFDTGE